MMMLITSQMARNEIGAAVNAGTNLTEPELVQRLDQALPWDFYQNKKCSENIAKLNPVVLDYLDTLECPEAAMIARASSSAEVVMSLAEMLEQYYGLCDYLNVSSFTSWSDMKELWGSLDGSSKEFAPVSIEFMVLLDS